MVTLLCKLPNTHAAISVIQEEDHFSTKVILNAPKYILNLLGSLSTVTGPQYHISL